MNTLTHQSTTQNCIKCNLREEGEIRGPPELITHAYTLKWKN